MKMFTPRIKQQGSALVISMVFLLVLTIAGITAMRFASLEEKMAANSQTSAFFFQQAQSEIEVQLKHLETPEGRNLLNKVDVDKKITSPEDLRYLPASASQKDPRLLSAIQNESVQSITDRTLRYITDVACLGASIGMFKCSVFELEIESGTELDEQYRQAQGFVFMNITNEN